MGPKIISSMAVIAMLLLLAACGGGGDDGGAKPELTGQFIDSAVAGLYYEASPSGQTGTTDAGGTFKYKAGDTIKFYVGDILIGSASAEPIMTPVTLVVNAVDETHNVVVSIASFLQSLDSDANLSNGIQIDPAVAAAAEGKTLDFSSAMFAADAAAVLAAMAADAAIVGFSGALVDPGDAMTHLGESISTCEHTGTYSGTWVQTAGPDSDNGTWTMSVSATGSVTGSGASNVFAGESFTMTGSVSPDGTTTAGSTDSGAVFNGTVAADGTLSGTWSNSSFGSSGTFAGARVGSAVSCSSSSPSNPAPGSGGNVGGGASLGSFSIAGDDVSNGSVASTFTPLWEAAVILTPSTTIYDVWTDLDTSAPPTTIGSLTHQLEMWIDSVTGDVTSVTFRATHLGVTSLFYELDCSSASCADLGVTANTSTKEVTFSNAELSVSGIFGDVNSATAPITLNGTIIYDADSSSGAPGDSSTPGSGSSGSTADTSAFAGTYTGTYTGEETGSWTFEIDNVGNLTGTVVPDARASFTISVSVSSAGVISGDGMTGTVTAGGTITGTWPGSQGAVGNTYSGSRVSG